MKLLLLALAVSIPVSAIELGFEWDPTTDPTLVDDTRIYLVGGSTVLGVAPMPDTTIRIDMGDLAPAHYCFVATHGATDDGVLHESGFSNEVCVRIPGKPQNLKGRKSL